MCGRFGEKEEEIMRLVVVVVVVVIMRERHTHWVYIALAERAVSTERALNRRDEKHHMQNTGDALRINTR